MPLGILGIFFDMVKCLSYLSFFNPKLILIAYREPLGTTIHLESLSKRYLDRRSLHDIDFLTFIVRFALLKYPDVYNTSWDTASRDDDFSSIRSYCESLSSEDKLIDRDVLEYFIFRHSNPQLRYADYREKSKKWK
jgi:hypothetical protein